MTPHEIIQFGEKVAEAMDAPLPDLTWNWFDWAHEVAAMAREFERSKFKRFSPQSKKNGFNPSSEEMLKWAKELRRLYDIFDREVALDPLLVYKPINHLGERFHKSNAFIRYGRASNRASKTNTGCVEHGIIHTGKNFGRWYPTGPHRTFIVTGTSFVDYLGTVFEAKFLTGEPGNPTAPMFPEGGRWLHHYDEKGKTIHLACPECGQRGKPKECTHTKGEIKLFSSENGTKVLEAFTALAWHIDENVDEAFFPACLSRTADQKYACGWVTATPLLGDHHWTTQKLAQVAEGNPALNRLNPQDPESDPYVEMFQINAYESNIVTDKFIENWKRSLDPFEIDARIWGRPAPQTKNPVFSREKLGRLREISREPIYGEIVTHKPLEEVGEQDPALEFIEGMGSWRVWFPPEAGAQYILSVDSARGLTGRDASCASVINLREERGLLKLRLDAQYHGWINSYDYGFEVFKGAVLYNSALAVIELTGGFGDAVLQVLTRTLGYWNIFRDDMGTERIESVLDSRMGVDTNSRTKPFMVGVAQQLLNNNSLEIYCRETLNEMANFEQEVSQSGKTVQFRGASKAPDDRAMSIIIGCYVAMKYPVFDFLKEFTKERTFNQGPNPLSDIEDEIRRSDPNNWDPFRL